MDNPDRDRVVLRREDMRWQQGDNSDSKGLEVEGHHIRCIRLAYGLDHRDLERVRCMWGSLTSGDSGHLLYPGNRLVHEGRPYHRRICVICLHHRQEDHPCGQDSRNLLLLRRMDDVDS